jgi:hypothetical protein
MLNKTLSSIVTTSVDEFDSLDSECIEAVIDKAINEKNLTLIFKLINSDSELMDFPIINKIMDNLNLVVDEINEQDKFFVYNCLLAIKDVKNIDLSNSNFNEYTSLSHLILNAVELNCLELFESCINSEGFFQCYQDSSDKKLYFLAIAEAQKNNNKVMEYCLCLIAELIGIKLDCDASSLSVIPLNNPHSNLYWNNTNMLIKILNFSFDNDAEKEGVRFESFLNGIVATLENNKNKFSYVELTTLISDAFSNTPKIYSQADMLNEHLNEIIDYALASKDKQLVAYIANTPGVCFKKTTLEKITKLLHGFPSLSLIHKIGLTGKLNAYNSGDLGEILKGLYLKESQGLTVQAKEDKTVFSIVSGYVKDNFLSGSGKIKKSSK